MQKSHKVVHVNTNMKADHVSLPKPRYKLCDLHDDDEDVFATSIIDRYAARPKIIANVFLAEFTISYDPVASGNYGNDGVVSENVTSVHDDEHCNMTGGTKQSSIDGRTHQKQQTIKLRNGLEYMRKRKKQAILRTR